MNKANFTLPGFYYKKRELFLLLKMIKDNPLIKEQDFEIGSVYGAIGFMIWNGGRPLFNQIPSFKKIRKTVEFYNSNGFGVNLTCTNRLLEERHLSDWFCNEILGICHNEMNSIILSSDILFHYTREKYPEYKIIGSVTINDLSFDSIKKKLQKFDVLVIPPEYNLRYDFLRSLPLSLRNKIEILVNEECPFFCKHRNDHFNEMSKAQLDYYNDIHKETYPECPRLQSKKIQIRKPMSIEKKDIKKLMELGIYKFKIQGRSAPPWRYINYLIHYLIKDNKKSDLLNLFCYRNLIM